VKRDLCTLHAREPLSKKNARLIPLAFLKCQADITGVPDEGAGSYRRWFFSRISILLTRYCFPISPERNTFDLL
jgi:hypothetical protein